MLPPLDSGGQLEVAETGQHGSDKTRVQFPGPVPAVIPAVEDLTHFWILRELHSNAHNSSPPPTPPTDPAHIIKFKAVLQC